MRDALILAGLTIGAVAALFPSTEPDVAQSELAPMAESASAKSVTSANARLPSGGMELRRAGDGHFYAPVFIGGKAITMLVDTGASVVALTGQDARAAGLNWNPGDLEVVAQGAGGPVRGVSIELDAMRLGAHEARAVRAVVIPDGLPISLLGQSFLKSVEPMRIEQDRMILGGS